MHEYHSGSVGGPRRGQGLRHASRIDVLVAKKDEYQQFNAMGAHASASRG